MSGKKNVKQKHKSSMFRIWRQNSQKKTQQNQGLSSLFYHDTQGKDTEHIMLDTNWLHRWMVLLPLIKC